MSSSYPLYAFHILESKLQGVRPALSLSQIKNKLGITARDEPSPLFITWNVVKHGDKQLRGCIGTFSPHPVEKGIAEYSLIAALRDTRFSPISLKELPLISVSVTLLQNFEEAEDIYDWELGKHGIRISFDRDGEEYGATFLPEVAVEHGWDKEETLKHLVAKAGYHLPNLSPDEITLVRYEGVKSYASYKDYKEFLHSI